MLEIAHHSPLLCKNGRENMLKSCQYCMRIHEKSFDCGKKPVRKKLNTEEDKFRWTNIWQKKRTEIKERDKYLCQVCERKLYNTLYQYNFNKTSVHHIEPLVENFKLREDNENLITLCDFHHQLAEKNSIPRKLLHDIAIEQEQKQRI